MNNKVRSITERVSVKVCILFAAMMLMGMVSAFTVSAAPAVKKTEYEGKGRVEVNFRGRVQYKGLKITVKDSSGKSYDVKIIDKDRDDIEFKIRNYKLGRTYQIKISGVRSVGESSYATVSSKVKIPKAAGGIPVEKVSYDARDREVSIEFDTFVQWKNPKVTISDGKKNYVVRIDEYDRDEIEVKVKTLKPGVTYTWKIKGIGLKGSSGYKTISGTWKVR